MKWTKFWIKLKRFDLGFLKKKTDVFSTKKKKKKTDMLVQVAVDVAIFYLFLFRLFDTSDFSIQEITVGTKLTRHWKVRD